MLEVLNQSLGIPFHEGNHFLANVPCMRTWYLYLSCLLCEREYLEALPNTPVNDDYAAPVAFACAECTIQGVTMAERVEPPTVIVWATFQRQFVRPTVPRAQGRQGLAAIIPESFNVAVYRNYRPNLMMHEGLLELLGAPRAELCASPQTTGIESIICTLLHHSTTPSLYHSAVGLSNSTYTHN